MATRSRHPKKAIEAVLKYAESQGWRVVQGGDHCWGKIYCPAKVRGGCIVSVASTPASSDRHAKYLLREIKKCTCLG
jgi:hypothetical protein